MKKSFVCIFPLLLLAVFLQGQSTVERRGEGFVLQERGLQGAAAGEESANAESEMMTVNVEQELQAQLLNWERLAILPLEQYLEGFRLFVEASRFRYEMQPYVLAECLWFQTVVLPRFRLVQQDGSLDKMMELNMTTLPLAQQQVADFLLQLEGGGVAIHPWSDAVATFFQELVQNPVLGLHGKLLEYDSLPELTFLKDDSFFMPVEGSYRNALLYHGLTDFHQLVSRFEDAMEADWSSRSDPSEVGSMDFPAGTSEGTVSDAAGAPVDISSASEEIAADAGPQLSAGQEAGLLPPPVGDIDWHKVVSDQALMYLLRHLPSGGQVYSYLLDYHTGETAASLCEDLYLASCRLQEQWGFSLVAALPDFSAAGVTEVGSDLFVLYCLSADDLERLYADLACVNTMAPAYFARMVSLLHRPASKNNPVEEKEGSL